MYTCFKRAWWRYEVGRYGSKKKVPNSGGRKTTLRNFDREEDARAFCKTYNDANNPGPLSIKCEYTS